MRIAVVAGKFPAPSEVFVLDQVTALLRHGHDVTVVANRRGSGPVHEDVARFALAERCVYRPPRGRASSLAALGRAVVRKPGAMIRSLNALRFGTDASSLRLLYSCAAWTRVPPVDAVVCHFGPNGSIATKLRRADAFRAPIATYFHGSDVFVENEARYRDLIRDGDLLLTISRRFREQLIQWGADPERVIVESMGVDLEKFDYSPRLPPAEGDVRLLTVARLVPVKGVRYAVEAVARLPPEIRARIRFDIIGDGSLRADIERRIRSHGLEDRVALHGRQSHEAVRAALDESHIFLLPSIVSDTGASEGMGVVLMEAMARGVAAIGTSTGGIPELIDHGRTGWLVEQRNPQAIADCISSLIREPGQIDDVLERARSKIEEDHDLMRQVSGLVDHLQRLAGER